MRRRLSALVVTAAVAGGVLCAALPAQAATTTAARTGVAAGGAIHVNIEEMRKQSTNLKAKADRLDRAGKHAEAKRVRAQAYALDRKIKAYLDADENMS
ncbi:hypothetical protein [Streptomyces sp. NPDC048612]|uniref:hypothetical protein n=1 Tax=Streptomyces sp. NPDC048612 TaxID=3365579 RepID=UPI00371D9742